MKTKKKAVKKVSADKLPNKPTFKRAVADELVYIATTSGPANRLIFAEIKNDRKGIDELRNLSTKFRSTFQRISSKMQALLLEKDLDDELTSWGARMDLVIRHLARLDSMVSIGHIDTNNATNTLSILQAYKDGAIETLALNGIMND